MVRIRSDPDISGSGYSALDKDRIFKKTNWLEFFVGDLLVSGVLEKTKNSCTRPQ
jgi:hypothetical protein